MKDLAFFNPSRLTVARKRRGMNMTRLATLLGVDLRSVSAYEKGEFDPDPERISKLAEILRFPSRFFFGPDLEEPGPDTASFRALSRMTAGQRDTALSAGSIAFLLSDWMSERFELPASQVPDLKDQSPVAAAESLRQLWGLGVLSIRNMVHLLESKGVRVFSLALAAPEVDAFSLWRQHTPYIFLNTAKSAEHSRFDAAHELGHLVLHRHGPPIGQQAEKEANSFASAFLMPEASVLGRAPRLTTTDQLIKLKKVWAVSVAALAYRLHEIRILSDWHYRSLAIEIAKRGYRKTEPNGIPRETSQVLHKVLQAMRSEGVSKRDIAEQLGVSAGEIDELIFGLTLTGVEGGGLTDGQTGRGRLRVVASN